MVDVTAQLPRRQGQRPARSAPHSPSPARGGPRHYAALDLGTNNCRLLIARPQGDGFAVVDAFSRIVRLGEGLSANGALSDAAIERTIAALRVCAASGCRLRRACDCARAALAPVRTVGAQA